MTCGDMSGPEHVALRTDWGLRSVNVRGHRTPDEQNGCACLDTLCKCSVRRSVHLVEGLSILYQMYSGIRRLTPTPCAKCAHIFVKCKQQQQMGTGSERGSALDVEPMA